MIRRTSFALAVAFAVGAVAAPSLAVESGELPGQQPDGRIRIANGWVLSPAGRQVKVGDFPLHVCVSPDERWAVVSHSDYGKYGLTVVDVESARVVQEVSLPSGWLGATFLAQGRRLAAAGGLTNRVYLYDFADGQARRAANIASGPPWCAGGQ